MNVLAPGALALLLLLPVVVAIHMWRVRHRRYTVSSTLLWSQVLSQTPLRRPNRLPTRYLLLALQLAALGCGALALARPAITDAGGHRHVIVALDTSLAMTATDVRPTRLDVARRLVDRMVDTLAAGDTMTVLQVGQMPRVLASSGDRAALRRAIRNVAPGYGGTALADAAPLLGGTIASAGPRASAYLFAALGSPTSDLAALRHATPGLHVRLVGTTTDDRAVDGLTVSCGRVDCEAYGRLINTAPRDVTSTITAIVDRQQLTQRLTVPAHSAEPIRLGLPLTAGVVEVRIDGRDALRADDTAWAIVPHPVRRTVLLVTYDTNSPLSRAVRAIPNLSVVTASPDTYADRLTQRVDLTVIDSGADMPVNNGVSTPIDPPGNLLVVNPSTSMQDPTTGSDIFTFSASRTQTDPTVQSVDGASPLLRGVDLGSLVVLSASRVSLPAWAHADVSGVTGPLLFSGVTGGRRVAVLLFDPHTAAASDGTINTNASNLDTLLAFPALLNNAVQTLAPALPTGAQAGRTAAVAIVRQQTPSLRSDAIAGPEGVYRQWNAILPSSGDVAALPPLRPGVYALSGAAGGGVQRVAVNAIVPQDTLSTPMAPGAPAPAAPAILAPTLLAPREMGMLLATVALILVSGEWLYYVRRT